MNMQRTLLHATVWSRVTTAAPELKGSLFMPFPNPAGVDFLVGFPRSHVGLRVLSTCVKCWRAGESLPTSLAANVSAQIPQKD